MFWATFDHFWSFLPDGDFFQKIRLSHTAIYWSLTPCWVSEKTNEPILRKLTDRQKTDGPKYGRTEGGTDRPYFIGSFWPRLGVQKYVSLCKYQ